ncbi:MAG: hypothetical protein H0X25_20045 [Acidobacteriales bacterium]|nr:hypothetical protein [Terriglobales bacterium]
MSDPTVRRLVQDAQLKAIYTPGGHMRVLTGSLDEFEAGDEQSDTTSSPLAKNRRATVEDLSFEVQELQVRRQVKQLRAAEEREEIERKEIRAAAERRQRRADDAAIAETRRAELELRRERDREERRRQLREFQTKWLRYAGDLLEGSEYSWLSASQRSEVTERLEADIAKRDAADEARMPRILGQLIASLAEPWQRSRDGKRQRDQLADEIVRTLSYAATEEDRAGALVTVNEALRSSGPDVTALQLHAIAQKAIAPIRRQIETREMLERVTENAVPKLPFAGRTEEDEAVLRRKARKVFQALPRDAGEVEFVAALRPTIQEISAAIERREQHEQRRSVKRSLLSQGLTEASTYLNVLVLRGEVEPGEVSDLQKSVAATLAQEITGSETPYEVREIVREIINDELELEEED